MKKQFSSEFILLTEIKFLVIISLSFSVSLEKSLNLLRFSALIEFCAFCINNNFLCKFDRKIFLKNFIIRFGNVNK